MTEPPAATDSRHMRFRSIVSIITVITVLAILGSAGYARFAGLASGPFGGDERYVVLHSLKFGTGDLNPRMFDWPASPFFYLTFACYGMLYVLGRASGVYGGTQAFALEYFSAPGTFYLIARLESACFGLGCAALLYATSRQLRRDRLSGVIACLFSLSCPILIQTSRAGLPDSAMTCFVVATFLFCAKIATSDRPKRLWYVFAGVSLGMAASMKYNGAIAALTVLSAHLYQTDGPVRFGIILRALFDRRLWTAAGVSVLTFFITTPFAILDSKTFLSDLSFQFANQSGRFEHVGITGRGRPFVALLGAIMPDGVGHWLWILAVSALPLLALRGKRDAALAVLTLPTALAYLVVAERSKILMPHYIAPMAPLVCVLGAFTVVKAVGWMTRGAWPRAAIASLVVAAVVFNPLLSQVETARIARVPGTHAAAAAWVKANLPPETKIVPDDPLFNFVPSLKSVERNLAAAVAEGYSGRADYYAGLKPLVADDHRNPHYDLYGLPSLESAEGFLDLLHSERVAYYLLSETILRRFAISADQPLSAKRLAFYRDLKAESTVVAEFRGDDITLKGPAIWIYRLPVSARER